MMLPNVKSRLTESLNDMKQFLVIFSFDFFRFFFLKKGWKWRKFRNKKHRRENGRYRFSFQCARVFKSIEHSLKFMIFIEGFYILCVFVWNLNSEWNENKMVF